MSFRVGAANGGDGALFQDLRKILCSCSRPPDSVFCEIRAEVPGLHEPRPENRITAGLTKVAGSLSEHGEYRVMPH
jgi:hypothetical protein